jgi:hypothetical protein
MRSRRYVTEHISVECPECQGQGYGGPEYEPCPYCGGDCWQYRERDVTAAFDALLAASEAALMILASLAATETREQPRARAEAAWRKTRDAIALALARGEGNEDAH